MEQPELNARGLNAGDGAVPLCVHVKQAVTAYLDQIDGHDPGGLYGLVIAEVERSLLEAVLDYAGHNQTKAAKLLAVSRSTLRKKMALYSLG